MSFSAGLCLIWPDCFVASCAAFALSRTARYPVFGATEGLVGAEAVPALGFDASFEAVDDFAVPRYGTGGFAGRAAVCLGAGELVVLRGVEVGRLVMLRGTEAARLVVLRETEAEAVVAVSTRGALVMTLRPTSSAFRFTGAFVAGFGVDAVVRGGGCPSLIDERIELRSCRLSVKISSI